MLQAYTISINLQNGIKKLIFMMGFRHFISHSLFVPNAWRYNWTTLFLGELIGEPGPPGWGGLLFSFPIKWVSSNALIASSFLDIFPFSISQENSDYWAARFLS
jgi:hypothetical protein